jgi:sodium transport system permease protein
MRERLREIRILYVRELRSALRERNIVINSIILPVVLYPAFMWLTFSGISFVLGQAESLDSRVMIQDLPAGHVGFEDFLDARNDIEITGFVDADRALEVGSLDLVLRFEERTLDASSGSLPGNVGVTLIYDGSRERSLTARTRIERQLNSYRQDYLLDTLETEGIAPADVQQFWVEQQNMASGADVGRFLLGMFVPVFMIVMLSVGAMYPAIDSTAGERENSTWETLMSVSVHRSSILLSKYLYVATMSFTAGMLNLAAMSLSLGTLLRPLLGDNLAEVDIRLPLGGVLVIALGAALLALFIAAGMMILASFARTFKEGQSMVGPFYVAVFLPVLFLQAPSIQLTPQLALIPIVNVTLMFREAFAGRFQWGLIGITVAIEVLTISLALAIAGKILQYEDFVIGSYAGSFPKFLKQKILGRGHA